MSREEARAFLLKATNYCSIDLPAYFCFDDLLQQVADFITREPLIATNHARRCEDVNYTLLSNKDGRYSWRPFEFIHPALYVSLVADITDSTHWNMICDRFRTFQAEAKHITCLSLPGESLTEESDAAEQVTKWWSEVEQQSIELSLDYEFMVRTDIVDCYAAIYTHSISWALHGRDLAKARKNDDGMIGNVIDKRIQDMHQGQTNGIPQGSVLMDFIAEMILGYADCKLAKLIESQTEMRGYRILRYRDDYRIFAHNMEDAERILKHLTGVLSDLGLKLSPEKTHSSGDVVGSSIKADKLAWMFRRQSDGNLQKRLLIVHNHGKAYPNAGSLIVAMRDYLHALNNERTYHTTGTPPLISIAADIAFDNPRTYPVASALLSKLISRLDHRREKLDVVQRIMSKFSRIPNTGLMQIWLQRISLPLGFELAFSETLCQRAIGGTDPVRIWNSGWISQKGLRAIIDSCEIVDRAELEAAEPVIPIREIDLYLRRQAFYE